MNCSNDNRTIYVWGDGGHTRLPVCHIDFLKCDGLGLNHLNNNQLNLLLALVQAEKAQRQNAKQ